MSVVKLEYRCLSYTVLCTYRVGADSLEMKTNEAYGRYPQIDGNNKNVVDVKLTN